MLQLEKKRIHETLGSAVMRSIIIIITDAQLGTVEWAVNFALWAVCFLCCK